MGFPRTGNKAWMSTVLRVEEEAFPASFGCHGIGVQLGVSQIRKEGGQVAPVFVWEVLLPECESTSLSSL